MDHRTNAATHNAVPDAIQEDTKAKQILKAKIAIHVLPARKERTKHMHALI
jgi:hypothetical protein